MTTPCLCGACPRCLRDQGRIYCDCDWSRRDFCDGCEDRYVRQHCDSCGALLPEPIIDGTPLCEPCDARLNECRTLDQYGAPCGARTVGASRMCARHAKRWANSDGEEER